MEIQFLTEDREGNVWFINHKKLGVLDFMQPTDRSTYSIVYFPELNGKILGGFESIYVYDKENVFVGATRGGIHLNFKQYKEQIRKPDVLISQVELMDQDKKAVLLFGGYLTQEIKDVEVNHVDNSFRFNFSTTLYGQQENIEFSYILEGFDKNWSTWDSKSEKEYTNLPPGCYIFKVKPRNSLGNESEMKDFPFTIHPPWYANTVSYVVYGLILCILIYLLFKWQKRNLQQKHAKELYLRQLELDRSEKEVVRLKNEKLESEIDFKNRELASMAMHLVQRGEVLSTIKENINSAIKNKEMADNPINLRQLIRLIRTSERSDEDWEQFRIRFNHVNEKFFANLKAKYADLTPNELKLCALLRMNLSTKEMAQLMHITTKAIEVARYRLRKKMKLESDVNLQEFLLPFTQK